MSTLPTADREPVDRIAGLVIRPAGLHDRLIEKSVEGCSQAQFADTIKKRLACGVNACPPPSFIKNWTGFRAGAISVVCYSHHRFKKGGRCHHYWIVRCDCGAYEIRRNESLGEKVTRGTPDACDQCKRSGILTSRFKTNQPGISPK